MTIKRVTTHHSMFASNPNLRHRAFYLFYLFHLILLFYLILHRPTSTYFHLFIYLFIFIYLSIYLFIYLFIYVYCTHFDRYLTMFYDIFVELLYEPCLVRIYLCILITLAAQISKTLLVSIPRNVSLSHTCT